MNSEYLYHGVMARARKLNPIERSKIETRARWLLTVDNFEGLKMIYDDLYKTPTSVGPTTFLSSGFNPEGMPNPSNELYFSNYNSPFNALPQTPLKPAPRYANFGAK